MLASSSRQTIAAVGRHVVRVNERQSIGTGSSSRLSRSSLPVAGSRRHVHTTRVRRDDEERKPKEKKEEVRFNFNTSLYFTEEPNPDVGVEVHRNGHEAHRSMSTTVV